MMGTDTDVWGYKAWKKSRTGPRALHSDVLELTNDIRSDARPMQILLLYAAGFASAQVAKIFSMTIDQSAAAIDGAIRIWRGDPVFRSEYKVLVSRMRSEAMIPR